jgi:hypothetical protein
MSPPTSPRADSRPEIGKSTPACGAAAHASVPSSRNMAQEEVFRPDCVYAEANPPPSSRTESAADADAENRPGTVHALRSI